MINYRLLQMILPNTPIVKLFTRRWETFACHFFELSFKQTMLQMQTFVPLDVTFLFISLTYISEISLVPQTFNRIQCYYKKINIAKIRQNLFPNKKTTMQWKIHKRNFNQLMPNGFLKRKKKYSD